VVEAAAAVFAEAGFDGARVSRIAEVAGLSSGAIYNHYRSKAELLAAAVEAYATQELNDVLAADGDPPAGILDLITRQGVALQHKARPAAALLPEAILAAQRDPEVAALLGRDVAAREAFFSDLVRLAQSSGEATDDVSAEVVARFCLMLGLGSLLVRAMDLPATDDDDWSSFITRLVDGFRRTEA
jgi:AcrR family transcriptional regulator